MSKTDAEPSRRTPTASRGLAREEAILGAAVQLVGEVGYDRVTVDAIAARAGASKATMYRKWAGKAEIVADALRRRAQGDGEIAVPDTGSLRDDLRANVAAIIAAITGADGPSLLGLVAAVRDDPVLRDRVRLQIEGGSVQVGRTVCDRAVERGELDAGADAAPVLNLAVAHVFLTTLLHGAPPDAAAQAHLVDTVLLPLLTGPSRSR